jgi:hypothetical protein
MALNCEFHRKFARNYNISIASSTLVIIQTLNSLTITILQKISIGLHKFARNLNQI